MFNSLNESRILRLCLCAIKLIPFDGTDHCLQLLCAQTHKSGGACRWSSNAVMLLDMPAEVLRLILSKLGRRALAAARLAC